MIKEEGIIMKIYKQTTYIKVNNSDEHKIMDKYSIYEMHDNEQIFNFDSFVKFLRTNYLPCVHIYYNWTGIITGIQCYPGIFWTKKEVENIKLYTITETVDTRDYKIDDLRKWLNADEFIEYITCVRLDMNEFIN